MQMISLDARGRRLEDRVRGERRRHVDHAGVRTGEAHGLLGGVVHRDLLEPGDLAAALARRDAGDDLGAVLDHLLGVERTGRARHAVNDETRVESDEDAH